MSHHNHEHQHDSSPDRLVSDALLASKINLVSGVAKTALGFLALSPVLITDGVHDFGDADTYREDARGIGEIDPTLKAKRKIRAGFKLGGYAVAGTAAETLVESAVTMSPIPVLSLVGGVGSFGLNWWVHKRFAHHNHDDAHEVKAHARIDLYASAVTIGASAIAIANPTSQALLAGSLVHIGVYSWQAGKTYRKFKVQARGVPD